MSQYIVGRIEGGSIVHGWVTGVYTNRADAETLAAEARRVGEDVESNLRNERVFELTDPVEVQAKVDNAYRRGNRKTRRELLMETDPGVLTEWEQAWRAYFLANPEVVSSSSHVNFDWPVNHPKRGQPADMPDLLAALQDSVDRARGRHA